MSVALSTALLYGFPERLPQECLHGAGMVARIIAGLTGNKCVEAGSW